MQQDMWCDKIYRKSIDDDKIVSVTMDVIVHVIKSAIIGALYSAGIFQQQSIC